LRDTFNDPLLVRTEKGMVPTERARELAESARAALDIIDCALAANQPFQPGSSEATFEVAASESASFMLLPPLISRLQRDAPGIQLRVRIPDLQRVRQSLEEGEIDMLLSFTRSAPEGLLSSTLWTQRLVVIAAESHPIDDVPTLDDFLRWPHACHKMGRGVSAVEIEVEAALAKVQRERTVGVWLPSSISVPAVVAHTDLLATVPEGIARMLHASLRLRTLEPPLPLEPVRIGMYWHERMHRNGGHRWLREVSRQVARALSDPQGLASDGCETEG
jgi:DNA-binding transcriptional LysR family regulator